MEDIRTLSHEIVGNLQLINADENDLDEPANLTADIVRNLRDIGEAENNLLISDQAGGRIATSSHDDQPTEGGIGMRHHKERGHATCPRPSTDGSRKSGANGDNW